MDPENNNIILPEPSVVPTSVKDYDSIPEIEVDPTSKVDLFEAKVRAIRLGLEKAPELSRTEMDLLVKLHGIKDIKQYLREEFEKYPVDKTYL